MKKKIFIYLGLFLLWSLSVSYADEITFPFYVYKDNGSPQNHGAPSGWLGDFRDLIIDLNCQDLPFSGDSCIRITYTAEGSKYAYWAGMYWQHPANNTGYIDGGIDLTGASRVTFWARGDVGGEKIDAFKFGGVLGAYPDTDSDGIYYLRLSSEWTKYEIDLTQCDLSYISSFFCWVANRYANPQGLIFYLDEIKIETSQEKEQG